jgi:hypothetical protein
LSRVEEKLVVAGFLVGSKGTGEESFTIRIPINRSPSSILTITPGESPLEIGGHPAAIFEDRDLYILEVYGFPSKEAAYESLPGIQAGVVWAALRHGISLPFPRQVADVVYEELVFHPEAQLFRHFWDMGWDRLDGYYPWGATVVKPEHKRLYIEFVGTPHAMLNLRDQEIASSLGDAMSFPNPEKLFEDETLRRALNAYMSAFFQFDDNSRFLTLITVLEILNPNRTAPQHVEDTINQLLDQVKDLRDAHAEDDLSSRYDDYESLRQRLRYLKTESIRKGIGSLVTEKLQADPEVPEATSVGDEAKRIYDVRSKLVHRGEVDEQEVRSALRRLMQIVQRVLVRQATHDT